MKIFHNNMRLYVILHQVLQLQFLSSLISQIPVDGFTFPVNHQLLQCRTNNHHLHHNQYRQQQHACIRTSSTSSYMSISPLEETGSTSKSTSTSSSSRGSTGRSSEEIERELSSGRILEDGPVIDFGSVKDSTSKAEKALAQARKEYEQQQQQQKQLQQNHQQTQQENVIQNQPRRLMGINDEVVSEVGREVGAFVDDNQLIQQCASYLRSKASPNLFQPHPQTTTTTTSNTNISKEEEDKLNSLLLQSYEESGLVTEAFAKTFYLGTQLLPQNAKEAIWAVYVWCRRTDEIVDAPRQPNDVSMLTDLSQWEIRLENLFNYGIVEDVLDLPLLDCKIKYPNLPIEPFVDMIRGMLMDIPELGQDRYDTFEELHLYCYRVAGTVGLMSMPVFGCAPGFTEDEAKEPALSLGVAFQLTNILRDVGEDAVKRGRIYLPREDMEKFGVTEEQIFARKMDDNYVAMMKYQIERARMYYDRALRGVPMLSSYSRLPVQSSLDCYGKILDKIEANGYDSLNYRAYVSKQEKLMEIPFSWYRTLDISKILPLPGDKKRE